MDKKIDNIKEKFKYRSDLIDMIIETLSPLKSEEIFCVYGMEDTGKTEIVKECAQILYNGHFAYIDSDLHLSEQSIFESILNQTQPKIKNGESSKFSLKCSNPSIFINEFQTCLKNTNLDKNAKFLLILDHFDLLKFSKQTLIRLLRINDFEKCVKLVFITKGILTEMDFLRDDFVAIYFQQYSMAEMAEILFLKFSKKYEKIEKFLLKKLIKRTLFVFQPYSKNFSELSQILQILLKKISINFEKIDLNIPKIKKIESKIIKNIQNLQNFDKNDNFDSNLQNFAFSEPISHQIVLFSAFLASFVNPILDRRFFEEKASNTRGKKLRRDLNPVKRKNLFFKPRNFFVERLFKIYCFLMEYFLENDKMIKKSFFYLIVNKLIKRGYLNEITKNAQIEKKILNAEISFEWAELMAKKFKVPLNDFLFNK